VRALREEAVSSAPFSVVFLGVLLGASGSDLGWWLAGGGQWAPWALSFWCSVYVGFSVATRWERCGDD
jgi:hypothetical protein